MDFPKFQIANIKPAKEIPSKQVTTTDFGVISTDLARNHLVFKVCKKTPPRESRTEIYLPTSGRVRYFFFSPPLSTGAKMCSILWTPSYSRPCQEIWGRGARAGCRTSRALKGGSSIDLRAWCDD